MHILNMATDYAIRCMIYLAKYDSYTSAREFAKATVVPLGFTSQIMRKLKLAGLVKTQMGNAGGYALAKDSTEISLYDIIIVMENYVCLNRCMEKDQFCSRDMIDTCAIRHYYQTIQAIVERNLKCISLHDIVKDNMPTNDFIK